MATLDDIINQSFQDELNRFNKKKIKSGENNNVTKLFQEVQVIKTDCNICYENDASCIQCYQCDFKYCQECLSKVISEFTRCSACQANFKDNYAQIKDKNKKKPTSVSKSQSIDIPKDVYANCNEDLLSDYEIEQLTILLQMENIHLEPNNKKTKKINYTNNTSTRNKQSKPSNPNYFGNTNSYLDNEFDDEIESCQFQTVKPNGKYNFRVQQNTVSNELIYTSNDKNLYPIVLNYKLLDKYFQRTVFISLVELIDKPHIFPNVWQTIASMIYNFTCNYDYLIHDRNIKNQTFLYQKQDLINTINQMVSS